MTAPNAVQGAGRGGVGVERAEWRRDTEVSVAGSGHSSPGAVPYPESLRTAQPAGTVTTASWSRLAVHRSPKSAPAHLRAPLLRQDRSRDNAPATGQEGGPPDTWREVGTEELRSISPDRRWRDRRRGPDSAACAQDALVGQPSRRHPLPGQEHGVPLPGRHVHRGQHRPDHCAERGAAVVQKIASGQECWLQLPLPDHALLDQLKLPPGENVLRAVP